MIDVDMAMTYLDFVAERHRIWELRQHDKVQPWTDDPILASRKFTNVFRVLDPGSQFVFELDDPDPEQTLARLFLYRHTNLPSAWRHVLAELGEWPSVDNLAEVELVWKLHRDNGNRVFSGAYMVYPQSSEKGTDKVESVIGLTRKLQQDGTFIEFVQATSPADRFAVLRRNKGVADFMSMQILTDYGYTRHGDDVEDEFVVAGPGAKRGAALVWPGASPGEAMAWAQEAVHALPDCPEIPLDSVGENYRKPSLMDIQNTFCEFGKYVRYLSRPSREQPYKPAHVGVPSSLVLPQHW